MKKFCLSIATATAILMSSTASEASQRRGRRAEVVVIKKVNKVKTRAVPVRAVPVRCRGC